MLRKFLKFLSVKNGRKNFDIDSSICNSDLVIYIYDIFLSAIRGLFNKFMFSSCQGIPLIGKNCTITFRHKISIGRGCKFGSNLNISGLCKDGISIGDNFTILDGSTISGYGVISNLGKSLTVGDNVGISQNCFLQIRGPVTIGNDVIIGPNVSIFSENHNVGKLNQKIRLQGVSREGVVIGNNVWIGANVTILDGVTIGDNVIIGAGSVVTRPIPANMIGMGIPARQINRMERI